MPVEVVTPNSDLIFKKWLRTSSRKKIEKEFGLKIEDISSAECVQNVEKYLIFSFDLKITNVKKPKKVKQMNWRDVKKTTFYIFNKNVNEKDWKDKKEVPSWNSIKPINCKNCKGTGKNTCKKCQGIGNLKCNTCNGTGAFTCTHCKGKGTINLELEVKDETGKKTRKLFTIQCPECNGSKELTCHVCGGVGKVKCDSCNGTGGSPCKKCKGTGTLFEVAIIPVPFMIGKEREFILPGMVEKDLKKLKLDPESVGHVKFMDINKITPDKVQQMVGYAPNDLSSQVKDLQKTFDKYLSDFKKQKTTPLREPLYPIRMIPLVKLQVVAPKSGKKFNLYSLGTDTNYVIVSTF